MRSLIGTIAHEFPRFDTDSLPAIPDEWEPAHYSNDVCPSWTCGPFRIWVDFPEQADRELCDGKRFLVSVDGTCTEIVETDDWDSVIAATKDEDNIRLGHFRQAIELPIRDADSAAEFLRKLHTAGKLFHLDDDPAEVVTADMPTFDALDCDLIRYRVAEVFKHHPDPHACAVATYKRGVIRSG